MKTHITGMLTLTSPVYKKGRRHLVDAVCKCGKVVQGRRVDSLMKTSSCGCYRNNFIGDFKRTHGISRKHPMYRTWNSMMGRCYRPKNISFPRYGGRGISVCERWHDFLNFVADCEHLYKPGLQPDRIDNDGNYEPSNVRFVTPSENMNNRKVSHFIEFNGERKTVSQWADSLGLKRARLFARIRNGKSVEEVLSTNRLNRYA